MHRLGHGALVRAVDLQALATYTQTMDTKQIKAGLIASAINANSGAFGREAIPVDKRAYLEDLQRRLVMSGALMKSPEELVEVAVGPQDLPRLSSLRTMESCPLVEGMKLQMLCEELSPKPAEAIEEG